MEAFGPLTRRLFAVTCAASTWLACSTPGPDLAVGPPKPGRPVGSSTPGDAQAPSPYCAPVLHGTPAYTAPYGYPRAACSSAEISALFVGCFGSSASWAACESAKAAYSTCLACIDTLEGADAGGPVIVASGSVFLNSAGCVALLDPDGGAPCARAVGEELDCEIRSCAAPCADAGTGALDSCVGAALAPGGVCAPYAAASASSCASQANDRVGATCEQTQGDTLDVASAIRIAGVFCGGLLPDGGAADATSDGGDMDAGALDAGAGLDATPE